MGFGASAKRTPVKSTDFSSNKMFFDTKRGIRVFRILPNTEEIRIKQHWVALNTDGTHEPVFGYSDTDKRVRRPVCVAVFDPSEGEYGTWNGASDNWYNNPINQWVEGADLEHEELKKMYAKEIFYLNVLNRTMCKVVGDVTHFPDTKNKFPQGTESIVAKMLNQVQILQGSSGKVRDENGDITGKHLYARLMSTIEGDEIDPATGNQLSPDAYDIRLLTSGTGIDTERGFSITANRDAIDWSAHKAFDLKSWLKPWPDEALDDLLMGRGTYAEIVKTYGIVQYPEQVPIFPVSDSAFDDGLPF